MFKFFLVSLFVLLSTISQSENSFPEIKDHWLRAAPPNSMMQAAYLTLTNNSGTEKTLVGAYSPEFSMAEFHKTIESEGLTKMQHQPQLTIENGESLNFKPGGLHIMLMKPSSMFKVGDTVKICLVYKNGDVQHINFPVIKK